MTTTIATEKAREPKKRFNGPSSTAILDGKAEPAGALQKSQLVKIGFGIPPVAVIPARWCHQPDFLVIADGLDRQTRLFRCLTDIHLRPISFA